MKGSNWLSAVLAVRQEMQQKPTGVQAELKKLFEMKAVVFDIYGTLLISGSGDVGSADKQNHGGHILDAIEAVGISDSLNRMPNTEMLHQEIETMNQARRSRVCPNPEVDIVEVWRRVLSRCGFDRAAQSVRQIVELAAQYESRANPTWPMPGSSELLATLAKSRFSLGIVSNAQVFTPLLVEDLLDSESPTLGGFDSDLCFFSNRFRHSKPGPRMYDALCEALSRRGILPHHAIYVGNDMLNDVWAASRAGLRTAWFAGDERSMRARNEDPRCQSTKPDLVLTNLLQLLECLGTR